MENTNTTIKDSVFEHIEKDKLRPTSKWYFRAQHAVLWAPGILVTALGAFAIAGMLFSTIHAGWEYRSYTEQSLASFLFQVIPFMWLVCFVLFWAVIVRTLRLTARGYRYKTGMILLVSCLSSVVLGGAIFALDMTSTRGTRVIRLHAEHVQKVMWNDPVHGRLAGVIDFETGEPILTDTTGHQWRLITTELPQTDLLADDRSVRVLGVFIDGESFVVCRLLPWGLSPLEHSSMPVVLPRVQTGPTSRYCQNVPPVPGIPVVLERK